MGLLSPSYKCIENVRSNSRADGLADRSRPEFYSRKGQQISLKSSPLNVSRRFGEKYRLHLQGRRIIRARKQRESRAYTSDMILRNSSHISGVYRFQSGSAPHPACGACSASCPGRFIPGKKPGAGLDADPDGSSNTDSYYTDRAMEDVRKPQLKLQQTADGWTQATVNDPPDLTGSPVDSIRRS
jgi:hypothetical protein